VELLEKKQAETFLATVALSWIYRCKDLRKFLLADMIGENPKEEQGF
jgi:hypothetical protein